MTQHPTFDVIIIGGSYAGLSAAMAMGRSLRNVLIIDSGTPCNNKQTPRSHNFLTQDGRPPAEISAVGKEQVLQYPTVRFISAFATHAHKTENGFQVKIWDGDVFSTRKLLFATGIEDVLPKIDGADACWGISLIHCPYCHGYEFRMEKTGILANGDTAFETARLISNWTSDLTVFTNGAARLSSEQIEKLIEKNIRIVETKIDGIVHESGKMQAVLLSDGTKIELSALYTRPAFRQQSDIPESLECEFSDSGHIRIDSFQKTTVPGVYAAGDNCFPMRSVSNAVFAGSLAGAMINKELIEDDF